MTPPLFLTVSDAGVPFLPEGGTGEVLLWVAGTLLLRLGETLLAALPELAAGLLLAGLARHLLGDVRLRRWFSRGDWRGDLPASLLLAVALPTGAMGTLAVAAVLRRAGVSAASVATVLLVGGAVTPLSLAYLLERAGPAAAWPLLAVVLAAGAVAFAAVAGAEAEAAPAGDDAPGLVPALAEAAAVARLLLLPAATGLLLGAAASSLLPASFFGEAFLTRRPSHLVPAALAPTAFYYGPETAALFAGEAVPGVYPGAAATMLLGGGVTLASLLVARRLLGSRAAIRFAAAVFVSAVGAFALLEATPRLAPLATEDSHAFDRLSRPFHVLDVAEGPAAGVLHAWSKQLTPAVAASGLAVAGLCLAGFVRGRRPAAATPMAGRHHLSTAVVRAFAAVAATAWVGGTLYVYYPAPPAILDQLRHAEGEVSSAAATADPAAAVTALGRVERLCWRGEVGGRLRGNADAAKAFADSRRAAADLRGRVALGPAVPDYPAFVLLFHQLTAARAATAF